jgi:type I restriction enzyme, S subunit
MPVAAMATTVAGGPFGSSLGRKDYVDDGVPVIRGSQLSTDAPFRLDDLVFVTEEKADRHRGNLAYPDDVIVTQRGTLGQVGIVPSDSPYPRLLLSQSQMKVTVDTAIAQPRFVFYALSEPRTRQRLIDHAMTAGVPHINLTTLREFKLSIPDLETQSACVEILDSFYDLIENIRLRIALLEQIAQAIYREWFVYLRYPGHEGHELVDSPLGPMPHGWAVAEMKEVCEVVDCLHSKKPTADPDGVGVLLQLFNIARGGVLDLSKRYLISGEDYRLWSSRIEVREGDCVVTNVGRVGAVAQVPAGTTATIGRNMTAIRPKEGLMTPTFLLEYLLSPHMKAELRHKTDLGTIMDALNVKGIVRLTVPVPPPVLVRSFEQAVRPVRRLIEVLVAESYVLREARDRLLPKLVTGAIDVFQLDIDDELLEDSAA